MTVTLARPAAILYLTVSDEEAFLARRARLAGRVVAAVEALGVLERARLALSELRHFLKVLLYCVI